MMPKTPADVTGDGAAHTLSSILGVTQCKWFQVTATNVANAAIPPRVGDAGVSLDVASPAVLGSGIPVQGGQFAPPIAHTMTFYDLTTWYLIMAVGDTASVACAI